MVPLLQKMQALNITERGGELRTGWTFAPSGERAGLEGLTIKVVFWKEFVAQKARLSLEYLVISFIPVALK